MNPFSEDRIASSGLDRRMLGRVLVVDDEPVILRALVRVLKRDWTVDTADSAEHALLLLASRPYDVVLTDYEMDGRDGIWLLRQLEQRYPTVRRVLHSGSDPSGLEEHVRSGLVQRFVQKPATPTQLAASLSDAPPPPY
jgi:two-component system NtrC family sensor kinase